MVSDKSYVWRRILFRIAVGTLLVFFASVVASALSNEGRGGVGKRRGGGWG